MRTAPDGLRYTKAEFFAFFAGYAEWDAAVDKLPPPAPVGAGASVETERRQHANSRTSSTTLAHLSDSTFDSLALHPLLQRAIKEVFRFERMTLVQQLAIPICLDSADNDVVAKARTGTGKTLGFLLPALHRVLKRPPSPGACCPILVLSPTRELATQTADEAKDLLKFVSPSKVMTVLGGTSMAKDVASFQQAPPVVLVATPGRLDDHLNNTAGVREMLSSLCVLVMDEADQLLDRGFRPSIVKILAMLPPPDTRQTLLFSATFPDALQELTKSALRPSYEMVDCVGPGPQSNEQVDQQVTICSIDDLHTIAAAILIEHAKNPEHKVMVFLPTAREAGFCAALFRQMDRVGTRIFEIHSKKSQPQRTATSEQFRLCQSGILFSSDVSARGMDYPDVTFVLQVGNPPDRAQYLHRLGRTARAGRDGAGLLLLCDYEGYWLPLIGDLPVTRVPPPPLDEARAVVRTALLKLHRADPSVFMMAYRAWLGANKGRLKELGWTTAELVRRANDMVTRVLLCPEVPPLDEKTIMSMGLRKTPGIVAAPPGVKLQQ